MDKIKGFGKRLEEERKRLSYTQKELADMLKITPLSISKYENGHNFPNITLIYRLTPLSFDVGYILLGERTSKEMSPEIRKKIALTIDSLEEVLGYSLDSLSRTKAIAYLANHFINAGCSSPPLPDNWFIDFIE